MKLKNKLFYNLFILLLIYQKVFSNGLWVNHGWEIFDYISDARSSSLANSGISYKYNQPGSSLINPLFLSDLKENVSLTHQTRFAGLINNDLLGFQIDKYKTPIQINILYQGVGQIPDTRNMLMDWGYDGQFGTNDPGEGNGVLDEGERLDKSKLTFFSQQYLGMHGAFKTRIFNKNFGVAFKFLSHVIGDLSGMGVGIDIGYKSNIGDLEIAGVAKNLPASGLIWNNGDIEKTISKLGVGAHYPIAAKIKPITVHLMSSIGLIFFDNSSKMTMLNRDIEIEKCFGIEGIYDDRLFIRLGKDIFSRPTGGVGLIWKNLGLDYAFLSPSSNGLDGNHHLISININLNKLKKVLTK